MADAEATPLLMPLPAPRKYGSPSGTPVAAPPAPPTDDPNAPLDAAGLAAWMVEDAVSGRSAPRGGYPTTALARTRYIAYQNMAHPERGLALFALIALTFVEVPGWCLQANPDQHLLWYEGPHKRCAGPDNADTFLSGILYLPPLLSLAAEALCWLYLAKLSKAEYEWRSDFFADTLSVLRAAVAVGGLLDLSWYALLLLLTTCLGGSAPVWLLRWRLAPYLRVVALGITDPLLPAFQATFDVLPAFFDVLAIFVTSTLCFSWLGAIMFDDLPEEASDGYQTMGDSIYTSLVEATNADFPDQMIPSFAEARWTCVYFVAFSMLNNFLFLNLVLAVVYNEYSDSAKQQVVSFFRTRTQLLAGAFSALAERTASGKKEMSVEAFRSLVHELNRQEITQDIHEEAIEYFYNVLDDDGSGTIDVQEFADLCSILQFQFQRVEQLTFLDKYFPSAAQHPAVQAVAAFARTPSFDKIVMGILCLNVATVLGETRADLLGEDVSDEAGAAMWTAVDLVFSMVYMMVLLANLAAHPVKRFFQSNVNLFDAAATVVLFGVALLWLLPFGLISREVLHYFMMLRMLRLLTLIARVERFKVIVTCVTRIVPASVPVLGMLFCVSYMFSAFGVQYFGGLVYDGCPALDDERAADYVDSDYTVLNLNDAVMGFVPLLGMIVSGGPITAVVGAYDAAAGAPSYVFFFLYYTAGCLVIFNVFVAFIIDAFLSQYEDLKSGDDVDEIAEELGSAKTSDTATGFMLVESTASKRDKVIRKMFEDDLAEMVASMAGDASVDLTEGERGSI